jgi:hypothetical protein
MSKQDNPIRKSRLHVRARSAETIAALIEFSIQVLKFNDNRLVSYQSQQGEQSPFEDRNSR